MRSVYQQHRNPKNQPSASQKQHDQPTRAGILSCDQNLARSIECAPRSLAAPSVLLSHFTQLLIFLAFQIETPSGSAVTLEEATAIAKQSQFPTDGPAKHRPTVQGSFDLPSFFMSTSVKQFYPCPFS